MPSIHEEVSIAAPPDVVWHAVHEDLENAPRWAGYLRRAVALDGPPGKGVRVRYELELPGGMRLDLVLLPTTWDRPHRCAGTFAGGPLSGTWSYTYVESGGGTDLRYDMDYELRGLLRFAGGLMRGQYADGIRQGMAMLKRHVESSGTTP